ncbi:hypothetical protein GGD41_003267 [Paraburkholderia bryophila]|uniref:Uncharacterized protein n=1 Tax=Paraburkholderia bryophila TaxID=420952 RepID=A0A7Z0AZU3_9BURK|nr:hypothetical protein [Paraburkholderia bryophila]
MRIVAGVTPLYFVFDLLLATRQIGNQQNNNERNERGDRYCQHAWPRC